MCQKQSKLIICLIDCLLHFGVGYLFVYFILVSVICLFIYLFTLASNNYIIISLVLIICLIFTLLLILLSVIISVTLCCIRHRSAKHHNVKE